LKAHIVSKVRNFDSSNVVAMLPGSSPKLKDQAVIYSAHYDHLGIGPAINGDNIYNGARDNATGCGILLELARAYATAAARAERNVIFASVTAEEQGLLGSEFLGKHLPVAAADVALDLNYDDVPPVGNPEELEVVGSERTTAYPLVEAVAKDFGLKITPDANPNAGHYYRSDHFSLARVGVPSFSINEGRKYKGHDREWGETQAREFNSKHYHQPSDEYHPSDDYTGDMVMARFGFAVGWKAASQQNLVQWQPGDEFEAARKKSEGQVSSGSK
jgi:Zn-dependent M28 family amino/carboxypeptidase